MIKTAIFAAAMFAAASPILASENLETTTVTIRTDDLDLANPADQHRLDTRIATTARRLCSNGVRGVGRALVEQRCVAYAIETATQKADLAIAIARADRRQAAVTAGLAG